MYRTLPLVERAEAESLDRKLRFLASAEARVQQIIGKGLARLFDGGQLISLGPARPSDYVRERMGISVREAQELARIERLMPQYPETDRLRRAGRLSRYHVREILYRVRPEDEFGWARLAAGMTVRQLKDALTARGLKPLSGRSEEGDGTLFEFVASPDLLFKWNLGMEIANRMWGREMGAAGFLDTLVMEASSEASHGLYRKLDEQWEAPSRSWHEELVELQAEGERSRERETRSWASLDWDVEDPTLPDLAWPEDADVFVVDGKLRAAQGFLQEVTGLLLPLLSRAKRAQIDQALQFRDFEHYARERLGMSLSQVNRLLRLERGLQRLPEVAEAYATGVLTQSQAEQVVRMTRPTTADAWIQFARQTTVRSLREVVVRGLSMPTPHADVWPPELRTASSCEARALLEEALSRLPADVALATQQTAADGAEAAEQTCAQPERLRVPDDPYLLPGETPTAIRFLLPDEVEDFVNSGLGLCKLVLGPDASKARCIELLVDAFLMEYLRDAEAALKDHPIPERDKWRCLVPGCTNKIHLQVHHNEYRSQGGRLEAENESTLCVAHHLQGIHAGRMLAKGHAPDDIAWVMGLRPDGRPGQIFIGDRLLYSAN